MGRIGFVSLSHPDYVNEFVQRMTNTARESLAKAGLPLVCIDGIVTGRTDARAAAA